MIGGGCGALFFLWLGDESLPPPEPVGLMITLEVVDIVVVVVAVVEGYSNTLAVVVFDGLVPFPLTLFITFELSFSNMSTITSLFSFRIRSTFAEVEEVDEATVEAVEAEAAAVAWAKLILGVVSVGVASAALQTGKKFWPFISVDMFVCSNIGPEMSNFLIGPLSGLGGCGGFTGFCNGNVVGGSLLLLRTEEVGEERPLLVMMVISS
jgi:hypothetical protein